MSKGNEIPKKIRRKFRVSLRTRGVTVLSVPLAALLAVLFLIYRVEADVRTTDQVVLRGYDARAELQHLETLLEDADAAVRGYLVTDQNELFIRFEAAGRAVTPSLARLATLFPASETDALVQVENATRRKLDILAEISTHRGDDALLSPLWEKIRTVDGEFGSRVTLLEQAQEKRLAQARADRDMARSKLFRTIVTCGIFVPLAALLLQLLVAGRVTARIQAIEQNAHRLAQGVALQDLPHGKDEIAAVGRAIQEAALLLGERERELRASEVRYRNLFDHAPLPFEETDRFGLIRRVNQAGCVLVKSSQEDLLGKPVWHFIAPSLQDDFRRAMLGRIATGSEISPYECVYLLEDGSSLTVEIRESLIRNESGEVNGICRSLVDITERNLAEIAARKVAQYAMELRNKNEQLAQALETARSAAEAKSQFLASMSHELRTPLNAIIGFSELMYDGKLGDLPQDHRECLQDILISARHLLRLISDILDLSKVEAGKMEFCPEPCQIETLVAEVRDVIRPLAEKKRVELLTHIPREIGAVIDASRFKQVLYNYLSNAVKFTSEGGWVTIRVLPEENQFRLEVEDTGIGIPANEISKLFQEFQQLPNSRKAGQGTGLGLALTRRIVEAQGGSVSVTSTPGVGSVFTAVLPLQPVGRMAVLAQVS
ncbi:MAG TPA: ATP-binding protein [Bryobacteraceae bacterium]|jgi:PAS domain S-box-containing protein|nr:ATP-binding protein [Bryobacteraceae bacterium]